MGSNKENSQILIILEEEYKCMSDGPSWNIPQNGCFLKEKQNKMMGKILHHEKVGYSGFVRWVLVMEYLCSESHNKKALIQIFLFSFFFFIPHRQAGIMKNINIVLYFTVVHLLSLLCSLRTCELHQTFTPCKNCKNNYFRKEQCFISRTN